MIDFEATFTERLPVKLTQEELLERGRELVKLKTQTELAEHDFAKVKEAHKYELTRIEHRAGEVRLAITTEKEPRDVQCRFEADWKNFMIRTIRTDTGEEVSARPMEEEERQQKLEFVGGKKRRRTGTDDVDG